VLIIAIGKSLILKVNAEVSVQELTASHAGDHESWNKIVGKSNLLVSA